MKNLIPLLCSLWIVAALFVSCSKSEPDNPNPPAKPPQQEQSQQVAVTSVSITPDTLELTQGESKTLTATVSPANATNKGVTWSSSNTAVATVNNGAVSAVGAGSATITVKTLDGNFTAKCTIVVKEKQITGEGGNEGVGENEGAWN